MRSYVIKVIYIIGVLLLLEGLLYSAARQKSFWEDEAFTAIIAQRDASELRQVVSWDVHPPLYLYLVNQWGKQFGFDELGLRSFSILSALATVLLTYKLARDLLGERVALIAIALIALMPLLVMYGHNARYYSLAMVLALLVAWGSLRFEKPRHVLFLILYILAGIAFLYLLFAAAVVLLAANLWWLARWIIKKNERNVYALVLWMIAQVAMIALYLPGLKIFQNVTGQFSELALVNNWLVEIAKRAAYYGFVSSVGETISPASPIAWLGGILVVSVVIYALVKNWRKVSFWLPVFFFTMIAGANLAITFNVAVSQTWQNLTYRALYLYPFLMIWLAAGFAQMGRRWFVTSLAGLIVVFVFGISNYFQNQQFLRPLFTVPWRTVFEQIQSESQPGALVICGFGDSSCYYYAGRYGYGQNDLNNWSNLSRQEYSEIWYIQTNLGREDAYGDRPEQQQAFFSDMAVRYLSSTTENFAPQDPSIRNLKARFLDQKEYEYRLELIKFFNP
jgi:4-amino-4-deoxy-L-arabinose transferase-like glycosyltransferase